MNVLLKPLVTLAVPLLALALLLTQVVLPAVESVGAALHRVNHLVQPPKA